MKNEDLLELLKDVRADYVATLHDNHGLKRKVRPFKFDDYPMVKLLDEAISEMELGGSPELTGLNQSGESCSPPPPSRIEEINAAEFGFKCAEKGMNWEATLSNLNLLNLER